MEVPCQQIQPSPSLPKTQTTSPHTKNGTPRIISIPTIGRCRSRRNGNGSSAGKRKRNLCPTISRRICQKFTKHWNEVSERSSMSPLFLIAASRFFKNLSSGLSRRAQEISRCLSNSTKPWPIDLFSYSLATVREHDNCRRKPTNSYRTSCGSFHLTPYRERATGRISRHVFL